ncbi:flagellar hook-length control protein FliK [Geomonas terrae]|uniref:Flagellar hook-length control protein FliK n=1 Tax=Geomonas terrae TaxID=2562681 RepID=A0A4S1CM48_9BACT|nr:flagellar hook-length control protein FliK [Geomonas terrae]TGU74885.1 flagellar hook-length control protein FliK [Geomonas terrae]
MMIQNAAFIPDAFPAAPAGTATPAALSGAVGFQQMLQGKQAQASTQDKAEAKQPAAESKSAKETGAKAEAAPQPERREAAAASRSIQSGESSQGAPRKGAVSHEGGPAVARRRQEQTVSEGAAAQEEVAATAGTRDEAPSQKVAATEDAATPVQDTDSTDLVRSAQENVPAGLNPDPNPGLVVAMAQVASHQEQNQGVGNADEAGAQALSRLEALQQRLQQPDAESKGPQGGEPEAAQAVKQEVGQEAKQEKTGDRPLMGAATGAETGQKAEAAQLTREERGAKVITPTGATERAQVEKPQAQEASGKVAQPKELPEAAKTSVVADQTAAAERLSARQQGEGRFVAMPVRDLSGQTAENAKTAATAVTGDTATEAMAPTQGDAATATKETSSAVDGATRETTGETTAKQAAVEVKVASGEGKKENVAGADQQTTQASADADPATGKAQQHREMRHGESPAGKEGRGAEQALQAGAAKNSGEEVSGTGRATPAASKLTPETGALREASEGHGGGTQQKGEQQNGHMLGAGVVAQGNTADTVPVEAKQAQARTQLHESILAQVKEGVVTHDGKGNGQMSIRLNPGELGELKIQVRMENNRLNVEIQADNRMVKDLLLGNLDSLKEALSGKNLTMDGFNVSTGGGGFNGPLNEERGNQKQQQPQRFARGAGYDGQDAPRVNYLTAEVNSLLDVRF